MAADPGILPGCFPIAVGPARLHSALPSSMKIRGTDFVMYLVSDLARAASFYRDILGLSQEVYS